jgi:predicted nucleic acid-binding protein
VAGGLVLDTGALIAFERRKRRVLALLDTAAAAGLEVRAPAAVVAEFWRGGHRAEVRELVEAIAVADTPAVARRAGEALAEIAPGPSVVDAVVAALASERGDRIVTSDPADLLQLAERFGRLRVLAI